MDRSEGSSQQREKVQGKISQHQRSQSQRQQQEQTEEVFSKSFDLLWTQAKGMFGEDASQIICDAVHSDDPQSYITQYLPNALTSAA